MATVGFNLVALVDKISEASMEAAEEWLTNSVKPDADDMCPFEEGTLVGTGAIVRDGESVKLVYGPGGAEDYASKQYYDASLRHPNGKTDHWVEKAADMHASELVETAGEKIGGLI